MEALSGQSSAAELTLAVLIRESQRLAASATTLAQIQGFVLTHSEIYIICKWLRSVRGRGGVLSCRSKAAGSP